MVRLLLTYGADPTLPDSSGETPTMLAATDHIQASYADVLFSSVAQNKWVLRPIICVAFRHFDDYIYFVQHELGPQTAFIWSGYSCPR